MSNLIFTPGFYTKVRVDDEGNIVDVSNLEAIDLPQHSHSISDLDKTELSDAIANVLSTFFANNGDCAVKFTYDRKTKTVSADVDIDEETIQKNEYGQLVSAASSGSSDTSDDVADISNQLQTFRDTIPDLVTQTLSQIFANNQNAAVVFEWDKNTKTYSADLRYDGISISKDENGDLVATGAVPGDGGDCASHVHTADQIEDLNDFVINIFNEYSKNINVDLTNLVDGVTIKINEYGQLVAVRTALEKHKHLLEDIIDYEAPDPAAEQAMSDLGEDVEYDNGVIDFSKLNIGYSILALSQYLKDVVGARLDSLTKKINNISTAGDNPGVATLSIHPNAISNTLYDKQTENYRKVYYSPSVCLRLDYLPYSEGVVRLLKDGTVIASADIKELEYQDQSSGVFKVENVYKKNAYTARVLKIDIHSFLDREDIYNFQIRFVQPDESTDLTNSITLAVSPIEKLQYEFKDTTARHTLNNTDYYDFGKAKTYEVSVKDFDKVRFVPYGLHKGVIEGSAEKDFVLHLPNLWFDTELEATFKLLTEHTDCPLASQVTKVQGGAIVNNKITPRGACTAYIDIPNSEFANALKITGNVLAQNLSIKKGDLVASGSKIIDGETGGRLPVVLNSTNTTILAFSPEAYDKGLQNIQLTIYTEDTVDLSALKIECLTL